MKAIPYSELLAEVFDLVGWNVEEPNAQETRQARRAISNAIGKCWRYTFWPDLMVTERRTFEPEYDSTEEVGAGEFRYFPPTDSYYQALQVSTGEAPAEVSGTEWVTNDAYWALARRKLSADPWDATAQYAVGDVAYNVETFKYYQVHSTPPVATVSTDEDYWGEVTELDPCIPWTAPGFNPIGLVEGVYASDPTKDRGAVSLPWDETANGLQIREECVDAPWVRYQLRVRVLTGETWSATASYDAVSDEDAVTVVPPVARGDYTAFETVGAARAATILATRVDILADGNGDVALFWRDANAVDDPLDVTAFVDAAGTAFRRVQRI